MLFIILVSSSIHVLYAAGYYQKDVLCVTAYSASSDTSLLHFTFMLISEIFTFFYFLGLGPLFVKTIKMNKHTFYTYNFSNSAPTDELLCSLILPYFTPSQQAVFRK